MLKCSAKALKSRATSHLSLVKCISIWDIAGKYINYLEFIFEDSRQVWSSPHRESDIL